MEQITLEQYNEIADAFDKAEESTIPFPVVDGDELAVVGDANKTEITKHDFKIRFTVPVEQENGSVKYSGVDKEYHDVFIKPRQRVQAVRHIVGLRPFYDKIKEDGGVERFTAEEINGILDHMSQEIIDHMYDLTALVLGVDEGLKDYMEPMSVIAATTSIIRAYTDMVNEADVFFDKSPVKR